MLIGDHMGTWVAFLKDPKYLYRGNIKRPHPKWCLYRE